MPGLRNTIALDFHLSQSALYWTDVVEDKIYRGKLLDNGGDGIDARRGMGVGGRLVVPRGHLGAQPKAEAEALHSPIPHTLVN